MTHESYIGLFTTYCMRELPGCNVFWKDCGESIAVSVAWRAPAVREPVVVDMTCAKLAIDHALYDIAGRTASRMVAVVRRDAACQVQLGRELIADERRKRGERY